MGEPSITDAAQFNGQPSVNVTHWRHSGSGHPMRVWRRAFQITLDDISFLTGISIASLSRIERFKQTPLISAAQKIISVSHGQLSPADFFNDHS